MNLFQRIRLYFQQSQLWLLKQSIQQVRGLCIERATKIDEGAELSTQESRAMLADIAHSILIVEHQINYLLGYRVKRECEKAIAEGRDSIHSSN